jgi:hypothetical protein
MTRATFDFFAARRKEYEPAIIRPTPTLDDDGEGDDLAGAIEAGP